MEKPSLPNSGADYSAAASWESKNNEIADRFYETAISYAQREAPWTERDARLVAMLARDAMEAYGFSQAERRVELELLIERAKDSIPPEDFQSIVGVTQKAIARRIGRNRKLVYFVSMLVLASTVWGFFGSRFTDTLNVVARYIGSTTRKDVILLRVGSPFDDSKPAKEAPKADGLLTHKTPNFVIKTISASEVEEYASEAKADMSEPDLIAFDNFGVFEGGVGVPSKSKTIQEAFGPEHFLELKGPLKQTILSRGWVYLNPSSRKFQKTRELAKDQRLCVEQGKVLRSQKDAMIEKAVAIPIPSADAVIVCHADRIGPMVFARVDATTDGPDEVGVVTRWVAAYASGGKIDILAANDDPVSGCFVYNHFQSWSDCSGMFDHAGTQVVAPASLLSLEKPPPVANVGSRAPDVRIISPARMIYRYGTGGMESWPTHTWLTSEPQKVRLQIVLFRTGKDEPFRFFVVKPVRENGISSAMLMSGNDMNWRVVSILWTGEMLSTPWQHYERIDVRE